MKILDIIYEGRTPKNFWSDEHQEFMRSNFQKQAQLNTIAYDLGKDIRDFIGGDINNGPQYRDSFGNTFEFYNVNFVKTHPQEKQPDSGIYKEKNTFIFNLTIDYRFYGDEIPHTLFTEPVRKMWDLINEKFSQTYDLSEFDFFIGIERMYYELGDSFGNVESDGHRKRNSISDLIPTGELWGSQESLIKCDENIEQNLSKSNFGGDVKINQIIYDKESLDKKYKKIYDVLRKGDATLPRGNKEPLVAHYELRDVEYEGQIGFKYFTIPTYNYDTGEIDSSKIRVRLAQLLKVYTDNPADNHNLGSVYMLVEKRLESKFKQFNIDLDIKFG
jgi:hypothetical protein